MSTSVSTYLWFSPAQENAIFITERVASAFSVVGCLFVVVTFLTSKRFRKPVNRLLFYATIGNLCMNMGTLISFAGIYAGTNSSLCQFQGFLIQMFLPADALWNLSMAINTYLTVFKQYDARRLRSLEWVYNLTNYGLPFIVALAYCFASTQERGKMYGPAVLWCWVGSKWDVFRIALCYAPAWIAILLCFTIYFVSGVDIYRKRNQLRVFRGARSTNGGTSTLAFPNFWSTINKTTDIRTTSELRNSDLDDKTIDGGQYHCSAEALPKNPFGDDTYTGNAQNPAMQANAAAWGYTKAAMLFFVSLLITWVPSSLFRVFSVVHPSVHVFGLAYAAALVLPLQGFWNAIIYIITSSDAIKAWFHEDILGRHPPPSSTPVWAAPDATALIWRANTLSASRSSLAKERGRAIPPDSFESLYGHGNSYGLSRQSSTAKRSLVNIQMPDLRTAASRSQSAQGQAPSAKHYSLDDRAAPGTLNRAPSPDTHAAELAGALPQL